MWLVMGSSPDRVKPKTIKLVFVTSPLSMCWRVLLKDEMKNRMETETERNVQMD
jgi:hypothetical protein